MRELVLLLLLSLAPTALASAGPMDEKDLQELATLIAHGTITEVTCAGEPEFDGTKTYTPFLATLSIDDVEKGEAVTTVTLPFSTLDFEPGASLPKCDWAPYYEAGYKGLFYLMSGADTDLYTLVGEGAYVPDADSVGEGLPSCEAVEADAVDSGDVAESTEDANETGPAPDAGGDEPPDEADDGGAMPDVSPTDPGDTTGGGHSDGGVVPDVYPTDYLDAPTSPEEDAPTSPEADAGEGPATSNAGGSGGGGCAGGGSPEPLPFALLAIGLCVAMRRRPGAVTR